MNEWQQNCFPQHCLSRWMGKLANANLGYLTRFGIKRFINHYRVNLSEAAISDYRQFPSFNAFFTRALKFNARPIATAEKHIVSPVDGSISELGMIDDDRLLQAKGVYYTLHALCGGDAALAENFQNGAFLTAYLAPKDYHRIHMPITGTLQKMIYVPGKLFSVNADSVKKVSNLFARNERVICVFDTEIGKVAVIAVGAMIVGSIATKWHGIVVPQKKREIQQWNYTDRNILLKRGEEMGYFQLGSTVIVLCEKNTVVWNARLAAGLELRMGEMIGNYLLF